MAYPIHETGDPAPWLREAMGDVNPRLAELAPHVVLEAVLYQLRAFRNAGFAATVVLSGHHGGNQEDLRRVARIFCEAYPFEVFACSDPELVEGRYQGDHPGYYEISQLLAIDPSLVDLSRQRGAHADPLGRFAQNPDAGDDDAADGRKMLEAEFESLDRVVARFVLTARELPPISMEAIAPLWASINAERANWRTLNL